MDVVEDIDILGDEAVRTRVATWSAVSLAATLALVAVPLAAGVGEGLSLRWAVLLGVVSLAALPVHELVHALAAKALGPAGTKVSFGYQTGMLYTRMEGLVLPRARMTAVLLAPSVLVSTALLAVPWVLGAPCLGLALCGVHLSGCTGDIAMVAEISRHPEATHVRDTDCGIQLLAEPVRP